MRNKIFEAWISKHFDGLSPFTLYQFCLTIFEDVPVLNMKASADDFVYSFLYSVFLKGLNPWEVHCSPTSFASLVFDELIKCPYIATPV